MVSLSSLPGISADNSRLRNGVVGIAYVFVALMVIGAAAPADDTEQASDDPGADAATDTPAPTDEMTTTATEAEQTTDEPTETEAPETEAPDSSSGDGYQVRVSYDGSWQGSINADGSSRSVDGSGTETFDIDSENPFSVAANAQKQDDSSGELTVEILKDGEVVAEQSTTAEYGLAQATTTD